MSKVTKLLFKDVIRLLLQGNCGNTRKHAKKLNKIRKFFCWKFWSPN